MNHHEFLRRFPWRFRRLSSKICPRIISGISNNLRLRSCLRPTLNAGTLHCSLCLNAIHVLLVIDCLLPARPPLLPHTLCAPQLCRSRVRADTPSTAIMANSSALVEAPAQQDVDLGDLPVPGPRPLFLRPRAPPGPPRPPPVRWPFSLWPFVLVLRLPRAFFKVRAWEWV